MNHAFKSIWNATTGTFVAVAENVNAKGKRSSSARKGGILAAAGALVFGAGSAMALEVPAGESLTFADPSGIIDLGTAGSITGLKDLTISGVLNAASIITAGDLSADNITASGTLSGAQITTTGDVTANGVLTVGSITTSGNINAAQVTVGSDATLAAGNKQVVTGGQLFTTNKTISDNKTTTDTAINTINTSLTTLGVDAATPGVKYFRANSAGPDAIATGVDSVAIGPNAKSEGANSLAAGKDAQANEKNSVAVGQDSLADGESSIALGDGAKVAKPSNGGDPIAAIAIGKDSSSSGTASIAMGQKANASGRNTLALGNSAQAGGENGIALGNGAVAATEENISIGTEAGKGTVGNLPNDFQRNIAIGAQSGQGVRGQFNLALGDQAGNGVAGNDNIAFGHQAGSSIKGLDNISIGQNANAGTAADRSVSIGQNSQALTEGIAIGFNSSSGDNGLALGNRAAATGFGVALGQGASAAGGYVALGAGSAAHQGDVTGVGRFTNNPFNGSAVSVGSSVVGNEFTRRIVNVADGSADTDAVNVGQLQSVVDEVMLGAVVDYDQLADKVSGNWSEQIAESKSKYVSVNDGGVDQDNKDNSGASAVDSVAIGPGAKTKLGTSDSVAIGHDALVEASSAVVLGHDIKGVGANSTTIGNSKSSALGTSGIAIGTDAVSRDANSIVIGTNSETDRQGNGPSVEKSIVIGTYSQSTAVEGIVIGSGSAVSAPRGIAQGSEAFALAADAMAFGTDAHAAGVASQASGRNAKAYAARGIATGDNARSGETNPNVDDAVNNRDSIAIGTGTVAEKNSSIALGGRSTATANFAQAFGENARATAEESIAQGRNAVASAVKAVAVGSDAKATAASAAAFGNNANAAAAGAAAFGAGATAQNTNSVAIGAGAKAESNRSVALGHGAVTVGATGTSSAALNGLTYGDFAGSDPVATVSVGTGTEKRTITNVAAGRISNTSTDAINGSQLFATNTVLGNVANSTQTSIGGETTLGEDGTLTTKNVGDTGKGNIHDAIKYAAQGWNVQTNGKAATNVAPGETVKFIDGKNIKITSAGKDITVATADKVEFTTVTVDETVTIGGDTTNQTIINQGSVTTQNLSVQGETKLGDKFVVNNSGNVSYEGDITEGNHITNKTYVDKAGSDLTELGLNFAGNDGEVIHKGLGQQMNIIGGLDVAAESSAANIKTVKNADGDLEIQLSKSLTDLETVTVDNTVIIGGDKTNQTIINEGSVTTQNLLVQGETKLGDKFVVNNSGNVSYEGDITEGNHITNKTYVDKAGSDLTELGLNFAGNTGDEIHRSLGETLGIKGGITDATVATSGENVITRTDADGNVNIELAKDATFNSLTTGDIVMNNAGVKVGDNVFLTNEGLQAGDTFITDAGLTFKDSTVAVTATGINAGGNKITNVAEGTDDSDAVNFGQLDKGLKAAKTEVEGVGNIEVTSEEKTPDGQTLYTVKTKADVEFDSVTSKDAAGNETVLTKDGVAVVDEEENEATYSAAGMSVKDKVGNTTNVAATQITVGGDNPIVMNGNAGMITGLQNTNWSSPSFATAGRAATEEQLKPLGDFLGFKDGDYTFNYNGKDHDSLAGALDSIHWNVEAPEAGGNASSGFAGSTSSDNDAKNNGLGNVITTPISSTNTVGFAGDANISVSKTQRKDDAGKVIGADIQVALGQDIKLNSITAIDVNATNVNTDSVNITNGPVINSDGIDMSDKRITNVAAGVDAGDAVNLGQLEGVQNNLRNEIGGVRRDLHKVDRKLRAGVAAAMATAGLPQAYLPGKSMVGLAGGTWNGESGVALGVSKITDNGKWVIKVSGNASTRGDYGGTVGGGYQW